MTRQGEDTRGEEEEHRSNEENHGYASVAG